MHAVRLQARGIRNDRQPHAANQAADYMPIRISPPPPRPAPTRSSSGQHIISMRCSSLVSAEMTEALILELLLMTGLLIVRHWSRIHAPHPMIPRFASPCGIRAVPLSE